MQKLSFLKENISRIEGETEKLEADLQAAKQEKDDSQADIEKKQADIAKILDTIAASDTTHTELEKKLRMDRRIVKKCPGPTVDFFRNRKRCPDKSMIWIRSCTV